MLHPFARVGAASYSIYTADPLVIVLLVLSLRLLQALLHQPLFSMGGRADMHELIDFAGPWAMDGLTLGFMTVVLALGMLSRRLVEERSIEASARLAQSMLTSSQRLAASAEPGTRMARR